jgi:hypothetical protein
MRRLGEIEDAVPLSLIVLELKGTHIAATARTRSVGNHSKTAPPNGGLSCVSLLSRQPRAFDTSVERPSPKEPLAEVGLPASHEVRNG